MRLLLLWSFAVSFRKTALNSDCIWTFYDSHARRDSNGVNFEHHRKLLSLYSSAVSFRRFYIDFFMILYMYIAAEQGQITSDDKISKLI